MIYDIAVQPKSFGTFDQWGCIWAKDMTHAYELCTQFDEDCVIWKCPQKGNPMPWVTVKADEANIQAIASILFD